MNFQGSHLDLVLVKSDQVSRIFGQLCSREVFALAPLTTEFAVQSGKKPCKSYQPILSLPRTPNNAN